MTDSPQTKYTRSRPWLLLAISWVIAFDVAWLCQRLTGAYASGIGAHAREATHFVTGLTLRDFVVSAPSDAKAREFVERYAAHYPVVDTHIWPPVFHAIESGWMMAFGTKRITVLMLMAALAATTATVLWDALAKEFGHGMATLGGLMLLCLPLFRNSYEIVLAEALAATLLLAAALKWGEYLEEGRPGDAIAFGVLCGLSLLTDLSGFALLIQAPVSALLARRAERLRQPAGWAGLALSVFISGFIVWYLRDGTGFGSQLRGIFSWEFTRDALPFYLGKLGMGLGIILLVFFVVGLIRKFRSGAEGSGKWITLGATLGCALALLTDVSGPTDSRHLVPLIALVVMFVIAGLAAFAERYSKREGSAPAGRVSGAAATVFAWCLAIAGVATAQLFTETDLRKGWIGYADGAEQILKSPTSGARRVLISSDPAGEGALISELAMRDKRPGLVVKQSKDELVRNDRLRGGIHPRFENGDELAEWIQRSGFTIIAVDHSIAEQDRSEVHDQLVRATEDHPEVFWPMAQVTITRGRDDAPGGVLGIYGIRNPRPPTN
jgi:hypothetical protein